MNYQVKLVGAETLHTPKLGESYKEQVIRRGDTRIVTKAVADSLKTLTYIDGNGKESCLFEITECDMQEEGSVVQEETDNEKDSTTRQPAPRRAKVEK